MVNNGGVKGFFGRTFCCSRNNVLETASASEPPGIYTITETSVPTVPTTFEEAKELAKNNHIRRQSGFSYKSCASSGAGGSVRSLQSVISTNTGNYDYFSIYSHTSETSYHSASS